MASKRHPDSGLAPRARPRNGRPPSPPSEPWRNRIVGHGEEAPDQLLANPRNWRVHPKAQQDALAGALGEVGWVVGVIVNKRTGHVVDGHARVGLAISRNEPTVPVVYVDLDENEEAVILASLDPLAAMAVTDAEKLAELLSELHVDDKALREMFEKSNAVGGNAEDKDETLKEAFSVLVTCKSEADQAALLEEFSQRGMECRALMS